MVITEIKIRRTEHSGTKMIGFASITLDDMIVINDIRILQKEGTRFFAMPNRRTKEGTYRDVVFPTNSAVRGVIEALVLSACEMACREAKDYMDFVIKDAFRGIRFMDLSIGDYSVRDRPVWHKPEEAAGDDCGRYSGAPSAVPNKSDEKKNDAFLKWLEGQ